MNSKILKLAALGASLAAAFAITTRVGADTPARSGFDPAIVPADAQWLFYLDMTTLRGSALGRELMASVPEINLDTKDMPIGVNIPKLIEAIGSATAYGTNLSENPDDLDGALVVRGSEELRRIVQGFLVQASVAAGDDAEVDVKELTDVGVEAYQVEDEVIVALPPDNAILVSKSRERLASARALLGGGGRDSMARAKSSTLAPLIPKDGTPYLLVASIVPRHTEMLSGKGPEARILQLAAAASVAIGENGPQTTARLQIDAANADMADRLIKILQGFVAMLSFAESDDEALAEFLRSVTVERTPAGALIHLAYPTDRLAQMLKTVRDHDGDDHIQIDLGGDRPSSRPAPVEGRIVAEWTADRDLVSDRAAPGNIVTKTFENITLGAGTMIWLNGNRNAGENGRFDYLEITPADKSGPPLRFEAENMRLTRYSPETVEFASGGEAIILTGNSGSARFAFPGVAGTYNLTVAYVDENDGRSPFSISLTDPKTPAGPEAATTPASQP